MPFMETTCWIFTFSEEKEVDSKISKIETMSLNKQSGNMYPFVTTHGIQYEVAVHTNVIIAI